MNKVFKSASLALVLVALVGCGGNGAIEAKVKSHLKDPESAKFGEIYKSKNLACGTVNAKNTYGGYVGAKVFLIKDDKLVIASSSSASYIANIACQTIKDHAESKSNNPEMDAAMDKLVSESMRLAQTLDR